MPANLICLPPSQPRRSYERGWTAILCQRSTPLITRATCLPARLSSLLSLASWPGKCRHGGEEMMWWLGKVSRFSQSRWDCSTPAPAAQGPSLVHLQTRYGNCCVDSALKQPAQTQRTITRSPTREQSAPLPSRWKFTFDVNRHSAGSSGNFKLVFYCVFPSTMANDLTLCF